MDIEKLIEQLNARGLSNGSSLGYHCGLYDDPDRPLEQWEQDWLAEVQRRRAQRGAEQDAD